MTMSEPTSPSAGPRDVVTPNEHQELHLAAQELMRRGQVGLEMTASTARYRQFALAQLLEAIAQAVETGQSLPEDLLRHASTLCGHILRYPTAPPAPDTAR